MKRLRLEEETSSTPRKFLKNSGDSNGLSHDMLVNICHFLPAREVFDSCALVSQDWYHSFSDQHMWKDRYLKKEWESDTADDTVVPIDQPSTLSDDLTDQVNWKACYKNSARNMWLMEIYLHRLKKRVEALANTPGITVTHFNLSEGITKDSAFEKMEKLQSSEDSDLKIPGPLRAFYRQTNGFALRWTEDPDAEPFESTSEPQLGITLMSGEEQDEDEEEEDEDEETESKVRSFVINIQSLEKCFKPLHACYFDIFGNDIDLRTLFPFSVPQNDRVDFLIDQNEDAGYTYWWIKRHKEESDWSDGIDWAEFTNGIKYTPEIASPSLYLEELLVGIDYFIALRDTTHSTEYTDVKSLMLVNPSFEWKDFEDERELDPPRGYYSSQDRDILNIANHRRLASISFCIRFVHDGIERVVSLYPKQWNKKGGLVLEGKLEQPLVGNSCTVIISAGRYKLANSWQNIVETKMGDNAATGTLDMELLSGAITLSTSAGDISVTLNGNYDISALINKIAGLGVWYRFTKENSFKTVGITPY